MPGFKSITAGGTDDIETLTSKIPVAVEAFPVKYYWFAKHGYVPHVWQMLFHSAQGSNGCVASMRHLVAGRRGGKTLSAAWEVLFYSLHPEEFHRDIHGIESSEPLWVWCLAADATIGRPSLLAFLKCLRDAGLVKGKDYEYNKTNRIFEFANGTLVEFKSAKDPEMLRGAGLDILWIDESATIPTAQAWRVVIPALADKEGVVWTTTTPKGKNWVWEEFWSPKALEDLDQFRVEYTSIDNPYFPRNRWEYYKTTYHPVMFKQEMLASFEAMAGVELHGDWLHYYTMGKPDSPDDIQLPETVNGKLPLRLYMGVDPAVSLSEEADFFAMALVGVTLDNSQAFILDLFKGRIPFPEQVDKIKEWHLKYRPQYIGIESNAYQAALAQQASRLAGFPPIVPIIAHGKKSERILRMSPLFKIGKVRLYRRMTDFIDQWVSYDSTKKNSRDDVLDAVEIAISVAGILLPGMPEESAFDRPEGLTLAQEAAKQIRDLRSPHPYDEMLGSEV